MTHEVSVRPTTKDGTFQTTDLCVVQLTEVLKLLLQSVDFGLLPGFFFGFLFL